MPIDITFKTDSDPSNFTSKTYNDQNYINVEGDTLQGDLDLNNHKITNVGTPTDDNDCSTKGYVDNLILRNKQYIDTKLTTMITPYSPSVKRYYDYKFIKDNFEPTFWISGYYNKKISVLDEEVYERTNTLVDLTGNGYISNGILTYERNLKRFRFTPENQFNIVTKTHYGTHFTFIIIMSQDNGARGRLFTSNAGNKLFGYWKDKYGSLFMDEDIKLNGKGVNDGQRYIFTLRNDNGLKTVYINNEQYHTTRAGVNNWGKVVIGKPLWSAEEAGTGYVYEAICFDKALTDSQITRIYTKLIKYYPALPRTTNAVPEDLAWQRLGLSPRRC